MAPTIRSLLACCIAPVCLLTATRSLAAPADFDSSFGNRGFVITRPGPNQIEIDGMAIQTDGGILVAGSGATASNHDFLMLRYRPDGSLDPDFGNGGVAVIPFNSSHDYVKDVALQPDGRIVAVGSTRIGGGYFCAIARFHPDGSFDTSFSGDGKQIASPAAGSDYAEAVVVQPDGRIVVAGSSYTGKDTDITVLRFLPDGTRDASFGNNGYVRTDFDGGNQGAAAVAIQPDGKIVIAGSSGYGVLGATDTVAIARFLPDGRLDPTFSGDGRMTTRFDRSGIGTTVRMQPDGRVVIAGVRSLGGSTVHLVRLSGDPPLRVQSAGSPVLNRQTGLYEQRLTITNFTGQGIAGFDLVIDRLPAGVEVNNATQCTTTGCVIRWQQAVPTGASITLVVEYFAALRGTFAAPEITATAVSGTDPLPPPPAGGLAVDRCLRQADGSLLIEFTATPGALYEIHYSDDAETWKLSPVRVRAAGNRVQWIDRGPPRTDAPPLQQPCRFYRVRRVPGS